MTITCPPGLTHTPLPNQSDCRSELCVDQLLLFSSALFIGCAESSLLCGPSLRRRAGATLCLRCRGFSLQWLLSGSTGFRHLDFSSRCTLGQYLRLVGCREQGLSCSAARGIFLNQGCNPCLLHWQADSLPLGHREALLLFFVIAKLNITLPTFASF